MKSRYLLLAVSVVALCACKGGFNITPVDPDGDTVEPAEEIVLTKAEAGVKDCANGFGFDVYRKIYSNSDMFYSPLSLSLALSMTSNGAAGTTQECMRKTLGFKDFTEAEMNSYYQKMTASFSGIDPKTVFEAANAVWADKSITLKDAFVKDCNSWYNATVKYSSLASSATVKEVNSWCAEKTHGKIDKIIDSFPDGTKIALLNALYFNGKWAFEFSDKTKFDFSSIDGKKSSVTCLSTDGDFPYAENKYFRMVELKYGNGAYGMVVLLPNDGVSFKDAVNALNADTWSEWTSAMRSCETTVKIPKFKMETEYSLADILRELGMSLAFSSSADFSNMSSAPMCLDMVKQKAYVDVTKEGTEAAAVTIVTEKLTSVGPSAHKYFIADRPFLFAIRERSTGTILFMGQKTK